MKRLALGLTALSLFSGPALAQGVPLGFEFRVNTYTPGRQIRPSVAADPAGNFVILWGSAGPDGSGYGVSGQRFSSSGATLGPEFRVNTYTSNDQYRPAVTADAAGNFVVVWQSAAQDGDGYGVFGQRFSSSGAPLGVEFRVNVSTSGDERFPSVASDSSGNFVVAWTIGGGTGIFGRRFDSGGAPLGGEFQVNSYTSSNKQYVSVASDPTGGFVVVWSSLGQDGSSYGVFGQRFSTAGAPLGSEFPVNTSTTGAQNRPRAAALGAGGFVVVWQSSSGDGSDLGVFGRRFSGSGSPTGAEFQVNTYTTNRQMTPEVASDAAGNFVVVWESTGQDLSGYGTFGQRYSSTGNPLGAEFQVNSYTPGAQYLPVAASGAAGNFVVAWVSYGQDGSNAGIIGQRYSQILPVELIRFTAD